MERDYANQVRTFYADILLRLGMPTDPYTPESSEIYPSGQFPNLVVFVGDAEPHQFLRVRAQLPAKTFLFWLYPNVGGASLSQFLQMVSGSGRNAACCLSSDAFYKDKLSMLIAVLPEKEVNLLAGPEARERHAEEIRAINQAITNALETGSQDTSRGLIRLRCSIRNLPSMFANAGLQLRTLPPETRAVVCGAGPSLALHLPLLKTVESSVLIVAVGHAVPSLVRAGITPHVVVEGDSQAFQNWPDDVAPNALLAACAEVSPEVAQRFEAVVWCAGCAMTFNESASRWGIPLKNIRLNKTVTVPALEMAAMLGCKQIALIGQDLSLSASGQLHVATDMLDSGDERTDVPGNDGVPVKATADLVGLREALQEYLQVLKQIPNAPHVFNCTAGGALIEHTERLSFEQFCRGAAVGQRVPALYEKTPSSDIAGSLVQEWLGRWNDYVRLTQEISDVCRKMRRELEAYPVAMHRVHRLQTQLKQLILDEERRRTTEPLMLWLAPVIQFVDRIMKETPGLVSNDTDPMVQLALLLARYGLLHDLCADIRADMEWVKAVVGGTTPPAVKSAYEFRSFRRHALSLIRVGNRSLAELLDQHPPSLPDRFSIFWINQHIPYVKMRAADGSWLPLSGFVSMMEQAQSAVDRFVAEQRFAPDRQAVVFVGAGNWIHIVKFAAAHPLAEIMVVDPWPELLSALIDRGCFLHLLPRKALVVCAAEALPEWTVLCQNRLREWRLAGREVRCFPHPRAADVPEIRQLSEQVQSWL